MNKEQAEINKYIKEKISKKNKIDLEVLKNLELAFLYDYDIIEACNYAKISYEIYKEFMDINKEYEDYLLSLKGKFLTNCKEILIKEISEKKNSNLALKILKSKKFNEFLK